MNKKIQVQPKVNHNKRREVDDANILALTMETEKPSKGELS